MDLIYSVVPASVLSQFLVGLSRTDHSLHRCIGLEPHPGGPPDPEHCPRLSLHDRCVCCLHGDKLFGGGSTGFWMALIIAPLFVALISLIAERVVFQYLYEREHLMLILLTFAFSLIFADLVKMVWGGEYKSVSVPLMLQGFAPLFGGLPFPLYNLFLLVSGPIIAVLLWLLVNKTRIGKIARAAAVDREMIGAVGVNVSRVFADHVRHRLLPGRTGGRPRRTYGECYPGNGSYPHHGGFPDRHHGWAWKCVGSALGRLDFRAHPLIGYPGLAAVRYRSSLCGGDHRPSFQTDRACKIHVVERNRLWLWAFSDGKRRVWWLAAMVVLFLAAIVLPRFYVYLISIILLYGLFAVSNDFPLGFGGIYQFHHAVFYGVGAYGTAPLDLEIQSLPVACLCDRASYPRRC